MVKTATTTTSGAAAMAEVATSRLEAFQIYLSFARNYRNSLLLALALQITNRSVGKNFAPLQAQLLNSAVSQVEYKRRGTLCLRARISTRDVAEHFNRFINSM